MTANLSSFFFSIWALLILAQGAIGQTAHVEKAYPPHALPSGASLAVEQIVENDGIGYQVLYSRPRGRAEIVWKTTLSQNLPSFSDMASVFEEGGVVTALVPLGTDTVLFRMQTLPVPGRPRTVIIEGIDTNSGDVARKAFRLVDHSHFEATDSKGQVNSIVFDAKDYTATMDGKPLKTWLYTDHRFVLPRDSAYSADDVFDGKFKVDQSPFPDVPRMTPRPSGGERAVTPAPVPPESERELATSNDPSANSKISVSPQAMKEQRSTWLWVVCVGIVVVAVAMIFRKWGAGDKS